MKSRVVKISGLKKSLVALAGILTIGGFGAVVASCGVTTQVVNKINKVYPFGGTFVRDVESRAIIADREVRLSASDYKTVVPDYSVTAMTNRFTNYVSNIGPNFKDQNTTVLPSGTAAGSFTSRLALAIVNNEGGDILGWRDPSTWIKGPAMVEKYLVYLQGGPLGDVCHRHVDWINRYDFLARDYYVNQGQYGFIPKQAVLKRGTTSATNQYFTELDYGTNKSRAELKNAFDNGTATATDYFRLIGGNADYDDYQIFILTSFTYALITADRTAVLLESLSAQTTDVYLLGESYGMHAGLELLLMRPEALAHVKFAQLGRNRLAAGFYEPPVEDKDGDGKDDSGVTYISDPYFAISMNYVGYYHGYLPRLTAALGSEKGTASDFLQAVRSKVTFGFSTDDKTIGPLPDADKAFYDRYGLKLEIKSGGHNAFFTDRGLQKLTETSIPQYDYQAFTTVTEANNGKGCKAETAQS